MDIQTLETWLWDAACAIRGPVDAPKFKDYILPFVFLERLSDVFEDELNEMGEVAAKYVEEDRKLVRFYLPKEARWSHLRSLNANLGEALTDAVRAVARHNPKLQGVIDTVDFNATAAGQRILSDGQLRELVQVLSRHRLGLYDVEPDISKPRVSRHKCCSQSHDGVHRMAHPWPSMQRFAKMGAVKKVGYFRAARRGNRSLQIQSKA
ncbi:MAG: type I restriction-modification system subunit M N-terminal domain-containing protein [Anaerolineales bacterium]|nr:type I restriction-modification system subunit M N-terminal domain-containing protein [Anaerolineales bacterium]